MTLPIDQARNIRDRKLRRYILRMLYEARGMSEPITGQMIFEIYGEYSSFAIKLTDERHALQLLNDLEAVGVAKHQSTRRHKTDPDTLDYRTYRITDKGIGLIEEVEPVIPTIDDDRITPAPGSPTPGSPTPGSSPGSTNH